MSVLFCFSFVVGCENETKLNVAHISDNTAAQSTNYSIKVVLDDDERVQEKYVDLQIKTDKENQQMSFGEDRKGQELLLFEKKDHWYNLLYLLKQSTGVASEYKLYKEYGSVVYNFSVPNDVKVTFRVVAGNIKESDDGKETILVLSEEISNELEIKAKKDG